MVGGLPAIAYYESSAGDLKFVRATTASGSSWGAPLTLASTGNTGWRPRLAVVGGNPAIFFRDVTGQRLRYIRALDANGTSWGASVVLDAQSGTGEFTSPQMVNGKIAVAFATTNGTLKFVQANDATGTSWKTPVIIGDHDIGTPWLRIANGTPEVIYTHGFDAINTPGLYAIAAADADGASWFPQLNFDTAESDNVYGIENATGPYLFNPIVGAMQIGGPGGVRSFDVDWIAVEP
jgi:hypothetical protein